MSKTKRTICSIVIVLLVIISSTATCFAAEKFFVQKAVDSNSFTYITTAKKEYTSAQATVLITYIHKADGSDSSYMYIIGKATSSGVETTIRKGESKDIDIPEGYQELGSLVNFYAKGRNPLLDCLITGYWNTH